MESYNINSLKLHPNMLLFVKENCCFNDAIIRKS